ncbi:MAG: phosphoribosyltransferase family protein [Patescibacteria group bacterium]
MDEPEKIIISWEQYLKLIEKLLEEIKIKKYAPQQIICIARGGLIPGEIMARSLRLPLAVFFASSYADGSTRPAKIVFSKYISCLDELKKENILLVDDMADSGVTLQEAKVWLNEKFGIKSAHIRTAVLWQKQSSCHQPDFCAEFIGVGKNNKCPWLVQPTENFAQQFKNKNV